jgi:hypothetical protein
MLKRNFLFATLMCAATLTVATESPEDAKPPQNTPAAVEDATEKVTAVEVHGVKDPEWKPYRVMLKGLDAFDKYRRYAPNAELRFEIRPQTPNIAVADVQLRIAGDDTSIPIPISENGLFTISRNQAAADENAEMVLNQKKDSVLWRPYIRSSGLDPNVRRLGDLRLECEIMWAVQQDDLPFWMRSLFRLGGGACHSSQIGIGSPAPRPIVAATLVSNEHRQTMPIGRGGKSFTPPLFDEKWNDDTLIEFQFSDESTTENAAFVK